MSERVYIAISGSEMEYPDARDSIQLIQRREGDSHLNFIRATKGYESRQAHITKFMETDFDYILFLDADHVFPRHTLERLRSHGLPFVSGFYVRRRYDLVAPVWYEPYKGVLPLAIWSAQVEPDGLYEIGASGWGCLLVHRDVITAVRSVCKGEWEVLEDDMDIMPYDLRVVLGSIRGLRRWVNTPAEHRTTEDAEAHVAALEREIVPLSYVKNPTGSDVRFAVFAKMAGYQLIGDAGVNARHIVDYPIGLGDYQRYLAATPGKLEGEIKERTAEERAQFEAAREAAGG